MSPDEVQLRVVCIPQAGVGAWAFHGEWQAAMPPGVEIVPVELPGRGMRMGEDKPSDMLVLVRSFVDSLEELMAERPYVLVGHSLGSWIAYEITLEMWRRRRPLPRKLYVSGSRAPHLAGLDHDADKVAPAIASLPDEEFWHHFERRYRLNEALQSPATRRFVLPLLRADFKMLEEYQPSWTGCPPLPCPIAACAARGDVRVTPTQLAAWVQHTCADRGFSEHWFEGQDGPNTTPHRYLLDCPEAFQAFLAENLQALLDQPLTPDPPPPAVDLPTVSAAAVPPGAMDGAPVD